MLKKNWGESTSLDLKIPDETIDIPFLLMVLSWIYYLSASFA